MKVTLGNNIRTLTSLAMAMRVHRPVGIFLLFWPSLWGLLLSSEPYTTVSVNLCLILALGSFFMRSAGCVINDYLDRDIDRRVPRTMNRPFARDQLSFYHFVAVTFFLLALSASLLLFLPSICTLLACLAVILVGCYPFMKRITPAPQIFLAFTMNYGMLIGYAAGAGTMEGSGSSIWILYLSAACWTLGYDTIYAMDDAPFDRELGLGSTAVLFQNQPKTFVSACYLASGILSWLALQPHSPIATACWLMYCSLLAIQILGMSKRSSHDVLFHVNILAGAFMTGATLWR